MLKSISRGVKKTYVGYTNNLNLRLNKHNSNKGAKSTKGYQWELVYKKRFHTKNKALSFEYQLKNNRKERSRIINDFNKKKLEYFKGNL